MVAEKALLLWRKVPECILISEAGWLTSVNPRLGDVHWQLFTEPFRKFALVYRAGCVLIHYD